MAVPRLGDVLVAEGVLSAGELQHYLMVQAADPPRKRRRLGRILLDDERVTEITVAMSLATVNGLDFVDLSLESIDPEVARSIPQSVAARALVLPLSWHGDTLRVAAADPLDVVTLDDVRLGLQHTGRGKALEVVVAPESQIRRRLASVWSEASTRDALSSLPDAGDPDTNETSDEEEQGAVAAVQQILGLAVRLGASDIHIEPTADAVRVRMRVDGALRKTMVLPKPSHSPLTSRIKIMADLDITQRRIPQDGRARIMFEGVSRNIRVSTVPTLHGEKVVIRLLTDIGELPALSALGMQSGELAMMHQAVQSSQGLVLITGPTGSGKTTTLYSAVHEIVAGDRNLITLEDPIEVEMPGVTQVQIDEKSGMTWAAGLRSVLRQDPDIIMVGEIRDLETAELALRAALTGHLVLATVHTIDAPSAILRLAEMGVPQYLIASSLRLAIAQRLVRKPCRFCVAPAPVDPELRQWLGLTVQQAQLMVAGAGCEKCDGLGYRGRTGIFEFLPVTSDVRAALGKGADAPGLGNAARSAGWRSLPEAGVAAALQGRTTVDELARVLIDSAAW